MKTIIKKTIIFEFSEVYTLLIKNKELTDINDFNFEVLPSTKGGFDIVAKKNISNSIVESEILSHLKSLGENNEFNVSVGGAGFVCREVQGVDDKILECDTTHNSQSSLLELSFDKLLVDVLCKNCRVRTLNYLMARFQKLDFTLIEVLNCTDKIHNFGKKSADDFAKELKRIGILNPEEFPFFRSWLKKKV